MDSGETFQAIHSFRKHYLLNRNDRPSAEFDLTEGCEGHIIVCDSYRIDFKEKNENAEHLLLPLIEST